MLIQNPWEELRSLIVDQIKQRFDLTVQLEEPNREGFGDWAFACFDLAKKKQQNPVELAKEMAAKVNIVGISTKAVGPYVNFYVDWTTWASKIIGSVGPKYGCVNNIHKTVVIDYSSPNPAHPFHMGTVRSTLLGEAICRIFESQGWSVQRLCYVNDLGRQAAIALLGYLAYAHEKKPVGKADVWLGQLYFKANEAVEGSPVMQERVDEILRECELGTKGFADVGRRVIDWCLTGFGQNWKMMDVNFDKFVFESQFVNRSKEVVESLKEKGFTSESDGATVLNLEQHGLPSTIILRSNGTALYLARDTAFALWRHAQWKPDRNVYVVAEDQRTHFQQLFKMLELLGYKELANNSHHLSYSMVLLEGKKMSSRAGRVVLWDDLLAEGERKIIEHMTHREDDEPEWKKQLKDEWDELPDAKKSEQARANALAAIKYFILRYGPEKPVDFHWDAALALEGDTGPYLQYTHARAGAIIKKAKKIEAEKGKLNGTLYGEKNEQMLIKMIAKYPDVLRKASHDMRSHYLSGYLFNLADAFNRFYESVPVLKTDSKMRTARLKLVKATKTVLANGLDLLGIEAVEKM